MKKLITSIAAVALLLTAGCAGQRAALPPEFYEVGVATALQFGLRNSPNTAGYLRAVQPVACAVARGEHLTPQQISDALATVAGKDDQGVLLVRGVQLLYIAAFNSVGGQTNASAVKPYADAIFCRGFAEGLAGAPVAAKSRNSPSAWPLLSQ